MFKDQIDYFESIRNHYGAYHNHKEISAWAGLFLYVIATGMISRVELPNSNKIAISAVLIIFVVTLSVLVYRYISNQLKMKDIGGAYVGAALWYINQLLNENFSKEELVKLLKIDYTYEEQAQSKVVLPNAFVKKANQLNKRARRFQDETRNMIFGLLIIFTLFSLSSILMKVIC